jgi:hypothetical protein
MNENPIQSFLDLLQHINSNLAQLVLLQQKRLENDLNRPMLTASALTDLFALVTALIKAKSDDDAKIASLNSQIAAKTANDASLNDPALQAQLAELSAAAAAATVDPNVVVPVTPVVPVVPPVDPAAPVATDPAVPVVDPNAPAATP